VQERIVGADTVAGMSASAPENEPHFRKHRRRLLGIDPAPTPAQAAAHAGAALGQLGLK
jgi:hypothetical protein